MKKSASLALAATLLFLVTTVAGRAAGPGVSSLDAAGWRARSRGAVAALAVRHRLAGEGDLREKGLAADHLGMTHRRLQQLHRGVPVLGGEAIVHLGPDGAVRRVTDAVVTDVRAETKPRLARREAQRRALAAYGCEDCLTEAPRSETPAATPAE